MSLSPLAAESAAALARVAPISRLAFDLEVPVHSPSHRTPAQRAAKGGEISDLKARRLRAPAHCHVFEVGSPADELYLISEGWVIVSRPLPNGRRSILDVLERGRIFGFSAAALHECEALTTAPSVIFAYDKARMMSDPRRAIRVHEQALKQMSRIHWLATVRCAPALARLAGFLADCVESGGGGEIRLDLPLSRVEIADYLELTVETVSRCITTLRDKGAVRTEGQRGVEILDLDALRGFAAGRTAEAQA